MFCGFCKKECDAIEIDDSFDYDGPFGTMIQHESHLESTCCGNSVYSDEECTIEMTPSDTLYEDRYDD